MGHEPEQPPGLLSAPCWPLTSRGRVLEDAAASTAPGRGRSSRTPGRGDSGGTAPGGNERMRSCPWAAGPVRLSCKKKSLTGAERCGAVRCGAERCGEVRRGAAQQRRGEVATQGPAAASARGRVGKR